MHAYDCKVVFCNYMVFCGSFGHYFCRNFVDHCASVLIALSSGSGICYFLLLLSAVLRASLCDGSVGTCSIFRSPSAHQASPWTKSLQWVGFSTSPLHSSLLWWKSPSEGRYCGNGFSLLGLGWKEVAEADVPTWNAPSMFCFCCSVFFLSWWEEVSGERSLG